MGFLFSFPWRWLAVASIGVGGGSPLTAFLTPQGEPFTGGTYFPKEDRFGRSSFKSVLRNVSDIFKSNPARPAEGAPTPDALPSK